MTLLCLDVSNSHTTIGAFDDDELIAHWQVSSDERRTSDEWHMLLMGLVDQEGISHISAVSPVLHRAGDPRRAAGDAGALLG